MSNQIKPITYLEYLENYSKGNGTVNTFAPVANTNMINGLGGNNIWGMGMNAGLGMNGMTPWNTAFGSYVSNPDNKPKEETQPTETRAERTARKRAEREAATLAKKLNRELTDKEIDAIKETKHDDIIAEQKKENAMTLTGAAMTGVFCAGALTRLATTNSKANKNVNEIFVRGENLATDVERETWAKFQNNHNELFVETKESFGKLERKFNRNIKALEKRNPSAANALKLEQQEYIRKLEETQKRIIKNANNPAALERDMKRLEKLNLAMQEGAKAKNGFVARTWRRIRKQERVISRKMELPKGKVKVPGKTTWASTKAHGGLLGGPIGIVMAGVSLWGDRQDIKDAWKDGTGSGLKQTGLSVAKATVPFMLYGLGDRAGKYIAGKWVNKGVMNLGRKMATKGASMAGRKWMGRLAGKSLTKLGTKIGTKFGPWGAIIGIAIGALADWAVRRFVFSAATSTAENVRIKNMTKEEAEQYLEEKIYKGEKLSNEFESIVKDKHPNVFEDYKAIQKVSDPKEREQLAAELNQKRQEQMAAYQQQLAEEQEGEPAEALDVEA